jgi:ABC-type multidrug transport system fused ATPase/permease subunit
MKNISKMLRYLRDYKAQITLYFFTSLLSVVFSLFSFGMLMPVLQVLFIGVQPVVKEGDIIGRITALVNDIIVQYDKLTALTYTVAAVVLFTMLKNLFIYLSLGILNPIRVDILRRLRNEMFTKALSLPIGFFTEERKGDLMSRMTNDITEVEISVMSVLETFIREPLTIIITITSMVLISPQLTLFLLVFLPVVGLVIGRIGKSLKKPSGMMQEQLANLLSVLDESIAGMRVVKAFNAERHQHLKFTEVNNNLYRIRNRINARRELGSPLSETMGIMAVSVIIWFGGRLIFSGESSLTAPAFIFYIGLFYQIINPLKNLSTAFYNIQKGTAAIDRIEHLLNVENTVKEIPNAKSINTFEHAIEFKNVHFSYGAKKILNGINLKIEKGKTIALVGASGAGKSTLVDLIPRFHDVTEGELLIDGVNIKDYKIYDVRRLMGVVGQDPILFNDTIYNNITLGTGGVNQQQVEEAATIAHAENFIAAKSEGYQTSVGDRGAKLSGGERQRITIARAVLKNPPILVLDEATSSLDTQSERVVQDAINKLMQNRTCIVIAHRLSTVQHADEIIVLEKGNIVERGNHNDLISKNGVYKKLVEMQQVK